MRAKGDSLRIWIAKFAQVDSVLSADGRRPVRRGQYTPKQGRSGLGCGSYCAAEELLIAD